MEGKRKSNQCIISHGSGVAVRKCVLVIGFSVAQQESSSNLRNTTIGVGKVILRAALLLPRLIIDMIGDGK